MKYFYLITALHLVFGSMSFAKTIYYGSDVEPIPIIFGNDPAVFRFQVDVKTITQASKFEIKPVDSNQFSTISVRPRFQSGSSLVNFILNDGSVVKTRLDVYSKNIPEKFDGFYDFKPKEVLLKDASDSNTGANLSAMELMKALIREDEVAGYQIRATSREIEPGFKGLSTKLIKIYTGSKFNGYIFELTRTSWGKKVLVDLSNLSLGEPNLALLSNVEQPVLDGSSSETQRTYLRVVAKPTAVYSQLVLPTEIVENPKKK